MQTSNRDYPIENNINDMLHTIEKVSTRLPIALKKENFTLSKNDIELLKQSINKLLFIIEDVVE